MNKYKMGQFVFFINMKDEKVEKGQVLSIGISTDGYILYTISVDGSIQSREQEYVFPTLEKAEQNAQKFYDIKHKMEELNNSTKEKLDAMRKKIIKEPQFTEIKELINQEK